MADLFDDSDEKELEEEFAGEEEVIEEVIFEAQEAEPSDARRRLESLLEERRLREELDDFLDY